MSERRAKARGRGSSVRTGRVNKGSGESDTALIDAISADFQKHGAAAIAGIRTKDPTSYLKLCASILPNAIAEAIDPLENMTDEELVERARRLATELDIGLSPNSRNLENEEGPK